MMMYRCTACVCVCVRCSNELVVVNPKKNEGQRIEKGGQCGHRLYCMTAGVMTRLRMSAFTSGWVCGVEVARGHDAQLSYSSRVF
jgi:hypothetical protein